MSDLFKFLAMCGVGAVALCIALVLGIQLDAWYAAHNPFRAHDPWLQMRIIGILFAAAFLLLGGVVVILSLIFDWGWGA